MTNPSKEANEEQSYLKQGIIFGIAPLITLLGLLPFPLHWLSVYWFALSFCIVRKLLINADIRRSFHFHHYISPSSSLQIWNQRSPWTWLKSIIIAVFLSATSIFLLAGLSFWQWATMISLIAVGRLTLALLKRITLIHLQPSALPYLSHRWVTLIPALIACTGLMLLEANSHQYDYSLWTANQIADKVITEHQHPVLYLQHALRTQSYLSLELLKLRDSMDSSASYILYLYFLLPSILPIIGICLTLQGLESLFLKRNNS